MKKNMLSLIFVVVIILILVLVTLFAGTPTEDIDVKVLDIYYQNNQYFLNVSIKNNQDKTGWISSTYLETVEGSVIDITGAGINEKVYPGETIYLKLFSVEITESYIDSPFTFSYTVFPSGTSYSVEI